MNHLTLLGLKGIDESSDPGTLSPDIPPPSPAHTRSHGKAKRRRIENLFIKVTKAKE